MDDENAWAPVPIEDEELDEGPAQPRWIRPMLYILGFIAAGSMIAVPALQASVWSQNEPPSAEERLRENVAVIFTSALLQRQLPNVAMRVATDNVRPQVDAIMRMLEGHDPLDTNAERITLRGTNCAGLPEASQVCYEATLRGDCRGARCCWFGPRNRRRFHLPVYLVPLAPLLS